MTRHLAWAGSIGILCAPSVAQSGPADGAAAELAPVVAVLTGQSSLHVERNAGGKLVWIYGPVASPLSSDQDPSISDNSVRLRNALVQARADIMTGVWSAFLVNAADSDHSGDTTLTEARALRGQVELAYFLQQLPNSPTIAELAQILDRDARQVSGDLIAYQELLDDALREGLQGLPPLPAGLLGAAQRGHEADEARVSWRRLARPASPH